jgi:hypothetical protein
MPPRRRAFFASAREASRSMSEEAIAAIRTRAELARRLSAETEQAEAKAGLLKIAAMLDAEADQLAAAAEDSPTGSGHDWP